MIRQFDRIGLVIVATVTLTGACGPGSPHSKPSSRPTTSLYDTAYGAGYDAAVKRLALGYSPTAESIALCTPLISPWAAPQNRDISVNEQTGFVAGCTDGWLGRPRAPRPSA